MQKAFDKIQSLVMIKTHNRYKEVIKHNKGHRLQTHSCHHQDAIKNTTKIINEYEVAWYKNLSIQKDVASLLTKNSLKKKLRKQSHLQSQQKKNKIILKVEQSGQTPVHTKHCRKIFCAHGLEELMLWNFHILPEAIYKFYETLSKSQWQIL